MGPIYAAAQTRRARVTLDEVLATRGGGFDYTNDEVESFSDGDLPVDHVASPLAPIRDRHCGLRTISLL